MWEYAVLSERNVDNGLNNVIIHADTTGSVKGFLRVECEGPINKGVEGQGVVFKVEENVATLCFQTYAWDAEDPLFEWPHPHHASKMVEIQHAIAWFNDKSKEKDEDYLDKAERYKVWTEELGTIMTSVEWIVEGEFTKPIYEASRVTQVLSLAGVDGWELVGNIPGGNQRMLRRERT